MIAGIVEIIVDVWIWKKRDLVDEDRSEFQLLSIDESLKIIVEDESTKDRDSFEDRDKGTSLTFVGGIVQIILDD